EPGLSYGLAEFIAAEEMDRTRGYWWAPDGTALLVARVDDAPVHRWYISDPANPARPAAEVAYPAAGTPNADVTLVLADLEGSAAPVTPADLQIRDVLDVDGDTVLFSAWADEPTEIGLWTYGPGGLACLTPASGVHTGRRAGGTTVISRRSLAQDGVTVRIG